ncbi:MAG: NAD-dependent protein deacylase [Defluviitaleaceae bacterium]|nr:NAD-dependent protein deacylase [Defluviitaleaceae bacterium]MCL2238440.1 NAD-dependent protein deacylase [Defluviitaleaceae bacterium]
MADKIKIFKQWVEDSENIVFFGGAGVSTESGIPDFRSVDGLYSQHFEHPPEVMLSRSFFNKHPEKFFRFYKNKLINEGVKPNTTHTTLAALEKAGKLRAVITQNIDGLHQAAGSVTVIELHGSIHRNFCAHCKIPHGMEAIQASHLPRCECGGVIKPDVVLFEEQLNFDLLDAAAQFISQAQVLIIGGTSLSVYPAAGLVNYYRGDRLVIVNKDATAYDDGADLVIREGLGRVFGAI